MPPKSKKGAKKPSPSSSNNPSGSSSKKPSPSASRQSPARLRNEGEGNAGQDLGSGIAGESSGADQPQPPAASQAPAPPPEDDGGEWQAVGRRGKAKRGLPPSNLPSPAIQETPAGCEDQEFDELVNRSFGFVNYGTEPSNTAPEEARNNAKITRELLQGIKIPYKAVFPMMSIADNDYEPGRPLDLVANLYPVTISPEQSYTCYTIRWTPEYVGNRRGMREWRREVWRNMVAEARRSWASTCDVDEVLSHGLGAWNMGELFYRTERLPEAVLNEPMLEIEMPHEFRHILKKKKMPITLHRVRDAPYQPQMDRVASSEEEWEECQKLLASVLLMFTELSEFWIEDRKILRMFYPAGYPNDVQSRITEGFGMHVKTAHELHSLAANFRNRQHVNNLYYVRTGCRLTPKVYPMGLFVNVWTTNAAFFKKDVTLQEVIDVIYAERGKSSFPARQRNNLKLSEYDVELLRCLLKSIKCYTDLVDTSPASGRAKQFFRLYSFSAEPCSRLKVGKLYRVREEGKEVEYTDGRHGWCGFQTLYGNHYKKSLTKLPHLKFETQPNGYCNYPAVQIHPKLSFYLPVWAVKIIENHRYSCMGTRPLAKSGLAVLRSLTAGKGAKDYFDKLQPWVNAFRER